ncbi:MAG TPA: [FeFe] hydrogenase H-cluster radical SAM maturase HydE [Syntrophomonadaceae bacterium]|nr:[FeFe] hydrogenase H-cluster radical SAM maturase HydE [Syntrophomonadaceae bacterium]
MDIQEILADPDSRRLDGLILAAEQLRCKSLGSEVYLRGLIEFSNICRCDCFYCGLRKSNRGLRRYHLDHNQIAELARMAVQHGLPSIALQSGEVAADKEVDFIAHVVRTMREESTRSGSPGLGITLSVGELTYAQYQQLFEAGAHRYLLRIESSDPLLFRRIHPHSQQYERRLECLDALKDIGFQVGTGVMIGLPGQTVEHLAADLDFFVNRDIDMLGMGPYIAHPQTPMAQTVQAVIVDPYTTTLKMMALARLLMPDINMVVSTALQSIHPQGLQQGVRAGGNVVMPVLTPEECRPNYSLYANKRFKTLEGLEEEVAAAGYRLAFDKWGDSHHYYRRRSLPYPDQQIDQEKCAG